jgi:hypothetical protein
MGMGVSQNSGLPKSNDLHHVSIAENSQEGLGIKSGGI